MGEFRCVACGFESSTFEVVREHLVSCKVFCHTHKQDHPCDKCRISELEEGIRRHRDESHQRFAIYGTGRFGNDADRALWAMVEEEKK